MRIAHIVPRGELPWSGILTVVVGLASALARRGHHVEVWQLHEWDPDLYRTQIALLDEAGVPRLPIAGRRRWWTFGAAAARAERDRGIQLTHLHSVFAPPNTAAARGLRRPYVLSPHGGYDPVSLGRSRYRKLVYGAVLERPMLRRAGAVVALTEAERAQVEAFGGIHAAAVIPNGVHVPATQPDGAAFRHEIGVDAGRRLAVFAGRLDVEHKGLDILVEAVAGAPEWHLALVGGDHRGGLAALRGLAVSLGAEDRVTFAGVRSGERLHQALAAADFFALTSRWEGLPMALLEALSVGTPALVSPPVERSVGVAAAGAGWVAEVGETATVLRRLSDVGEADWAAMRQGARGLAARYDWDAVAGRYERVYARLVGAGTDQGGTRTAGG